MMDLKAKLDALSDTSLDGLRRLWYRLYNTDPPSTFRRELLTLGVAWKLQADALGGLSPALSRRIASIGATIAEKGDLPKARAIQPRPGARLMRVWQGQTHTVLVKEEGFEWQGERYASLSAIAFKITGTRWSGPRFFGLNKPTRETADG
jgi:hypothetical protein